MTPALILDPCEKIEGIGVVQSTEKKTEGRNDNIFFKSASLKR